MSRYIKAYEKWQSGILGSDFLVTSDEDAYTLDALASEAYDAEHKKLGNFNATTLLENFGRGVVKNLMDERFGLREGVTIKDEEWKKRYNTLQMDTRTKALDLFSQLGLRDILPGDMQASLDKRMGTTWQTLQGLTPEQIKKKLDNTHWSITSILGFANQEYGGMPWLVEHLGEPNKKENVGNDSTAFGKAVNDYIQAYATEREDMAKQRDKRKLTKEDIDTLNQKYLKEGYFEKEYLMPALAQVGYESAYDSIVAKADEGGKYLNKTNMKYHNFMRNLKSGKVFENLPKTDLYEYLGHEYKLRFPDMVKKLTGDGNIEFTGYQDLLFRNIKDNKLVIGDIKTYGGIDEAATSKILATKIQTMLYSMAEQFKDGGSEHAYAGKKDQAEFDSRNTGFENFFMFDPTGHSGSSIVRDFGADDTERQINLSNVKRAIVYMQALGETGLSSNLVEAAVQKVNNILYGSKDEKDVESFFDGKTKDILTSKGALSIEGIGAQLAVHEEYKDMLQRLQQSGAHLSKMLGGSEIQYDPFSNFSNLILRADKMANELEPTNHAEATRLKQEIKDQEEFYYTKMPRIAETMQTNTAKMLSDFNNDVVESKSVKEAINDWNTLAEAVRNAELAFNETAAQVAALDEKIRKNDEELERNRKQYEEAKTKEEKGKNRRKKLEELEANWKDTETSLNRIRETNISRRDNFANAAYALKQGQQELAAGKDIARVKTLSRLFGYFNTSYDELLGGATADAKIKSISEMVDAYKANVNSKIAEVHRVAKITSLFGGNEEAASTWEQREVNKFND